MKRKNRGDSDEDLRRCVENPDSFFELIQDPETRDILLEMATMVHETLRQKEERARKKLGTFTRYDFELQSLANLAIQECSKLNANEANKIGNTPCTDKDGSTPDIMQAILDDVIRDFKEKHDFIERS